MNTVRQWSYALRVFYTNFLMFRNEVNVAMAEQNKGGMWEAVFVPKEAISRQFVHEKTNRELTEIVLPNKLPDGAPDCGGWHFYMPTTCVREAKTGAMRVTFPPSWTSIRFLSPYEKGKRTNIIEFPVADALALLRDSFNNKR